MNNTSVTLMQTPSKEVSPENQLWQSIRTIISFQNQAPALERIPHQEYFPLSFPQERLWLLSHLNPQSTAYNLPFIFAINGELNVQALCQSFQTIWERHKALRTNFVMVENQPRQVIRNKSTFELTIINLKNLSRREQEIQTQQIITATVKTPFDLSNENLFRVKLLHCSQNEHLLIICIHHIVFDGWSEGILWQELGQLYQDFSQSNSNNLSALPIQYVDFAHWQKKWLQGDFLQVLRQYWQQQLGTELSPVKLPTTISASNVPTHRSSSQEIRLSQELTQQIKQLSRQRKATLYVTLLTTFQLLLHGYTQQEKLFVCTPSANRNRQELKGLIGYFVNLLILQTDFSGNPSFPELLTRVKQIVSAAFAHQDFPVQELGKNVSLSQVMFTLQNFPQQNLELGNLEINAWEVDSGTADFDLSLFIVEQEGRLTTTWKYNLDLFENETISQMSYNFQTLLTKVVANPDESINSLIAEILPWKTSAETQLKYSPYLAPRDAWELQLKKIWEQVLGIQKIGVQANFFNLGGNSLLAANLMMQIQQLFGKDFTLDTLLQAPTIEQLANIIRQDHDSSWSSLVAIKPGGSQTPLFAIPAAGSSGMGHYPLAKYLNPNRPVYGLQALGLDGKQTPQNSIELIAAHYLQEIRTLQPQGPYYLEGHCFGGLVAWEIAQQLQHQGEEVALLALLDTPAPYQFNQVSNAQPKPKPKSSSLYQKIVTKWQNIKPNSKQYWQQKIKNQYKKTRKKIERIVCKIYQILGITLPHRLRYIPILAAAKSAIKNYVPQPYSGKVVVMIAQEQNAAQFDWSGLVTGELEVHQVAGNHHSMLKEPDVKVLANKLNIYLD